MNIQKVNNNLDSSQESIKSNDSNSNKQDSDDSEDDNTQVDQLNSGYGSLGMQRVILK